MIWLDCIICCDDGEMEHRVHTVTGDIECTNCSRTDRIAQTELVELLNNLED